MAGFKGRSTIHTTLTQPIVFDLTQIFLIGFGGEGGGGGGGGTQVHRPVSVVVKDIALNLVVCVIMLVIPYF